MKLQLLLFLPILAFAGSYSGTVVNLSGNPLQGVTISSIGTSTTSNSQGQWTLVSGTSRIAPVIEKSIPVTRNLSVENGHLNLSWNGMDLQGRRVVGHPAGFPSLGLQGAARLTSTSDTDTIVVQWNGNHLVRLPMTDDSTGIVFSIDTAWSDDQDISWNPRIIYGSLPDSRDGHVYRTVVIGTGNNSQTWMAENLTYIGTSSVPIGTCCTEYGGLYNWGEAMAGSISSLTTPSGVQGICPTGWHIPSTGEWSILQNTVDSSGTVISTKLKSTTGWHPDGSSSGNGTDDFGFRALPGGMFAYGGLLGAGVAGYWWSAMEANANNAWLYYMVYDYGQLYTLSDAKTDMYSLRCIAN